MLRPTLPCTNVKTNDEHHDGTQGRTPSGPGAVLRCRSTWRSSLRIYFDASKDIPEVPGHGASHRGAARTHPAFEMLFTFAITMCPCVPPARVDGCFHLMVISMRRLWHGYERRAARLAERLMRRQLSSVPLFPGQWYAALLYTTMVVRVLDSPFLNGDAGLATMRCGPRRIACPLWDRSATDRRCPTVHPNGSFATPMYDGAPSRRPSLSSPCNVRMLPPAGRAGACPRTQA